MGGSTQPSPSRSERWQAGVSSWTSTLTPVVGLGAAVACLVLNHPEGFVPFTGLAMLPSVVKAQRKRNDRRDEADR